MSCRRIYSAALLSGLVFSLTPTASAAVLPEDSADIRLSYDASDPGSDPLNEWQPHDGFGSDVYFLGAEGGTKPALTSGDPSTILGINAAYVFNGTDSATSNGGDYFEGGGFGDLTDGDSVAFEVWFKVDDGENIASRTNMGVLFEAGGLTDGASLLLDGDTLRFVAKDNDATAAISHQLDPTQTNLNNFVQVVGRVENDADPRLVMFINGKEAIVQTNLSTSFDDWAGGNGSGIGSVGDTDIGGSTGALGDLSSYGTFDGQIAIVRIYSPDISAVDAQKNYDSVYGIAPGAGMLYDANTELSDISTANIDIKLSFGGPDMTPTGGVTRVGGSQGSATDIDPLTPHINHAFRFDGVDDYLVISDASNDSFQEFAEFDETIDATFEVWFRPDTDTGGAQIIFENGGGTGVSLTLVDGDLTFQARESTVESAASVTFDISDKMDRFIQAVGVIDVSTDSVELFINGVSVGTAAASSLDDWSGGDGMAIAGPGANNLGGFGDGFSFIPPGGGSAETYGFFDGDIAIFRVYNEALDANAVMGNYTAIAVPEPGSLTLLVLAGAVMLRRR